MSTDAVTVIPPARAGHRAEIAATVRGYHAQAERQSAAVRRVQRLAAVRAELSGDGERAVAPPEGETTRAAAGRAVASLLDEATAERRPHATIACS